MTPFGVRQFRRLLIASLAVNILGFVGVTMGNVLSGQFLGQDALAGVAIASPLFTFGNFLVSLVGAGTGIVYSLRRGRLEKDGAELAFVQGIWTALTIGAAFGLVAWLFREQYFLLMNPTPAAVVHAREYWTVLPFALALMPINAVLLNCCWCDGDSRLATVAYCVPCALSILVSWLLLRGGCGAASCSIGFLACNLLQLAVLVLHFFRASNTYTFRLRFGFADTFTILKASAGDALGFFGDALVYVVVGVVVSRSYGQSAMVFFPLFVFVSEILSYATGFAAAMQPIVAVYFGEGNHRMVRVVANAVFSRLAALSAAFSAVLLLFPEAVVWAVGIEDQSLVATGCSVVRWSALMILPFTLMNVLNNYFQFVEHEGISVGMTVFYWFVMPIGSVLAFSALGHGAFWCWCPAARWGGIAVFALFLLLRYGRRAFPYLLDREREAAITVFDLELCEMQIAGTAEHVARKLMDCGVAREKAMRARLLVEESLMVVKDRDAGKRIFAEVTLDLNDGIKLTLRDDGEIFDITDADAKVNGLRTYLVATLMQRQSDKVNILTTGFNRNVFRL